MTPDNGFAHDRPLFSAILTPHRSLSSTGFLIVMLSIGGLSFVAGAVFLLLGAWPVFGFLGLDVLLVYWAFRANFRAARAYELLRLTSLELLFARVSPRGARQEWRFNPLWVRFERVEHEEFGTQRLSLVSRGQSVEVGRFLGPDQKATLARAFALALSKARLGPRYS